MKLLGYIFSFVLLLTMPVEAVIVVPNILAATAIATGIASAQAGHHTKKYYLVQTILADHSNRLDVDERIKAETNGDSFFNTADITEINNIVDAIISHPTRFRIEGRNLILEKDFTQGEVTTLLPDLARPYIGTTMTGGNTNRGRLVFQIDRMSDDNDFNNGGTLTGYPY